MSLAVVGGSAHPALAAATAAALDVCPVGCEIERFPDGEQRPTLAAVRGDDVYVVQPTGPPASDNLLQLLLLVDACRRAGAARVTAVIPYLAYARQDRRSHGGQGIGARVVMDAVARAGADRLVLVDPHTPAVEAMCPCPVETLTAVPLLVRELLEARAHVDVVVAPDLGAAKLADRCAAALDLPVAVVRKVRLTGATVHAQDLAGDVAGLRPLVVDDMVSTAGTVAVAVDLLVARGAEPDVSVAATHGLFVGPAVPRLDALPIRRVVVTDSMPPPDRAPAVLQVLSLADLLADAIRRLHDGDPMDDLLLPS